MILQLKKKLAEKRAAASKIVTTVAALPETRDLSPEEKAQFDKLMGEVDTIKGQIAALESTAPDEAEAASDEPAPEPRSSRRGAPIAPGDAPAVHTEARPYSYLRALRLASEGRPLDGLEGEISREIEVRTGGKAKGFFLPTGSDAELRSVMAGRRRAETRADMNTTTGTGSIFTVPEMPLIELLRAKLVIAQLGATMLNNMSGLFAIPRVSGAATVSWLAEGNSATADAPTLDNVGFSPKVAITATNITKQFMNQTSLDAEAFVKNELALALSRDIDRVAIRGGGSNEPTGILGTAAVATQSSGVQGGTNGLAPTWNQVVGLETLVADANADEGKLAYLTNAVARGYLKRTLRFPSSSNGLTIWEDGAGAGVGEVNGYTARTTTNVPKNLTKGTAAGICSAIIFGNFADLVVATWEGVDTVVNPYTNQLAGSVIVSMTTSIDVKLRHSASFAAIFDALTS